VADGLRRLKGKAPPGSPVEIDNTHIQRHAERTDIPVIAEF
jgi:hypothetical protein